MQTCDDNLSIIYLKTIDSNNLIPLIQRNNLYRMGFDKAHKMAQRLHRERRQPEHRKKMGYLEKKKDYKKRAIDHHMKAERLKKLKNKALDRNPNEFHFHMLNSRVVDGVHQEMVKPLNPDVKKKMVKKEELVRRYNQQVMLRKKCKSNPKGIPDDFDGSVLNETEIIRSKPKHIIFNR